MKLGAARAAVVVAAGVLLGAGVFLAAPFQTTLALRRATLRLGGVRRVRLDGGLLAWENDGCRPGRPCRCVALIHGLGDSALTWDKLLLDSRISGDGARLLAPDMPGTDGSAPPASPAGYGIRAQARTVRSALEGVCPQWTVVGNSLGGWISLWLALDWPQGVRGLVLADAAGISDPSGRAEESARTLAAPTLANIKEFGRRARYRRIELPDRVWKAALASILSRPTGAIVATLSRAELLDDRLGALKIPTSIVWGETDGIVPIEVGERMHRLIAGSRYRAVKECGHMPQIECPDSIVGALADVAPAAP
ncbi:MAG: alpha/beta fold hydrolase [Elusimicrobiota bacterium]